MRKAKDIINLPILTLRTAHKVGEVHDVLFDPAKNRVLAFLVDEGGWFDTAKVVPFDRVHSVGRDAVIIEDDRDVVPAERNREVQRSLQSGRVISSMRVFTDDGRDLGTIGDMFIDEHTGEVTGYEVSGGFLAETLRGKQFMPAPETLTMGRHLAYVPSETGDKMEQQVSGGIQAGILGVTGAAQATGEAIGGAAQQATESIKTQTGRLMSATKEQQLRYLEGKKAGSAVKADGRVIVDENETVTRKTAEEADKAGVLNQLIGSVVSAQAQYGYGQLAERGQSMTDQLLRSSVEQQKRFVVGQASSSTVRTPEGKMIVAKGEKISRGDADEAERTGVLGQLVVSATGTVAQTTGNQFQQGARQAYEDLRNAVSGVSGSISGTAGQASQAAEKRRIDNALGRPVTRVILDQNDNVILNTGDIITNESIRMAREADTLDILLSSVSTQQPTLSQEERRAMMPGEASLNREHPEYMARPEQKEHHEKKQ